MCWIRVIYKEEEENNVVKERERERVEFHAGKKRNYITSVVNAYVSAFQVSADGRLIERTVLMKRVRA